MNYNKLTNNNQSNNNGVFEVERFKDRLDEIKLLHDRISSKKFEFCITYGRRRVGKTALHLHVSSQYSVVYFLARRARNIEKFKEQCVKVVPEARMIALDYESLFEFLKDKVDGIIIDEFPNLIHEEENILHIFQAIIDTILPGSSLSLFLLGSSISVMKSKVLPASSPLYGRKTLALKLAPVPFYILSEYYPQADLEEIIEIYGLTDGTPYYLNQIDDSFWRWLDKELNTQTFIRDEGEFLVKYEFINSGRYLSILEAVAFGHTQMNQIAQYTRIPVTSLSSYLHNLREVEFIVKEIPVTEQMPSKRGLYRVADNFLNFWFRFIYPELESLDQKLLSAEDIRAYYPEYMGNIFEKVVAQFLIGFQKYLSIPKFTKIGRWWWDGDEIDLIAFNRSSAKATLVECKWKSNVNPVGIASKLLKKESKIQYRGKFKQKTHVLMVFAKSFSKKISNIGENQVICMDLHDMKKIITEKKPMQ